MSRAYFTLPDNLEADFREKVMERFGMKKGNLSKAAEEAIRNWIDSPHEYDEKPVDEPDQPMTD